jgi:hypothetical protein
MHYLYMCCTLLNILTVHLIQFPGVRPFFLILKALLLRSRSRWPLPCWDCGFESRRGHGCMPVVSVVFCLSGRGLCDGLITRPEESLQIVVCLSMILNPR